MKINEPGGTMHFQAPEHFSMDNDCWYDPLKTDLWSYGICLYIFIFEEYPFDAESEIQLQIQIGDNNLEFNCNDNALNDLLKKILNKNPKERADVKYIKNHAFVNQD